MTDDVAFLLAAWPNPVSLGPRPEDLHMQVPNQGL